MPFESYLKQLFILMTVQVYFPKNVFYISPKVSYPINSFHKETVSNPEWSCWSPRPGSLFLSSWSRLFNTVIKLGGKNHNAKQINPALHTIMYGMWYRRKMIWALFILKYTWQPLHFNKLLFLRTRKSSSPHSNEGIWGVGWVEQGENRKDPPSSRNLQVEIPNFALTHFLHDHELVFKFVFPSLGFLPISAFDFCIKQTHWTELVSSYVSTKCHRSH